MTKLKSLLLGSAGAAVLLSTSPVAMAADAPMAAGREPVYRCETTGFWEIPGTDSCIKIGGRMRFYAGANEDNLNNGAAGFNDDWWAGYIAVPDNVLAAHTPTDTFWMHAEYRLNIDVRSQTEYGLLRGFFEVEANDNDGNTGGSPAMRHAYVQIGNFLMGKTWSLWTDLSYANYSGALTIPGDDYLRVVQARYTQPFGNGFELAVALEDPARHATSTVGGAGVVDSRNEAPAGIARLSVKGDWGQAYVSGAVVDNSVTGAFGSEHEMGFAVGAGLTVNVPTGEGDALFLRGTYTDGASRYSTSTGAGSIVVGATSYETVEITSGLIGFTHNWSPSLNSSIGAGYTDIDYNVANLGATDNLLGVFANIYWTPVKNFEVGLDVTWGRREINAAPGADDDGDSLGVLFQATRYF